MIMRGLIFIALLLPALARAEVKAWLDRDAIALGETVTLNIQLDRQRASQPDLSVLDADFDRLGSSSSTQLSFVNGKRTAATLFAVALSPKREGSLIIPALLIDGDTTPVLQLTVKPSPVRVGPGGDVFIETEVDTTKPYVQQQIRYTVRLFFGVTVLDGQLSEPEPEHVRVLRLGNDKTWQAERDGRRYSVVERTFALVPERSGNVEIDAPVFAGRGLDRQGGSSMFGGGIRLSARGEPVTLDVRPSPPGAAQPWLPAEQVTMSWLEDPRSMSWSVGEPVTLGIRLQALGLGADQLPEIELPRPDSATLYPDQDSSRDSTDSGKLAAERTRRFAIVPQKAGRLIIHAPTVTWWDVAADVARTATLPDLEIDVRPAAPSTSPQPVTEPPSGETGSSEPESSDESSRSIDTRPGWWKAAFFMALAGWVATLAWALRRTRAAVLPVHRAEPEPTLQSWSAMRSQADLTSWARALRESAGTGRSEPLAELAVRLDDAGHAELLRRLERHLYAAPDDQPEALLDALRRAFPAPPPWRHPDTTRTADTALPPLYG